MRSTTGVLTGIPKGMGWHQCRMVDPTIGRFTSFDSYAGDPSSPLSLHKYAYVQNDPVDYHDPSGHSIAETLVTIDLWAIGISLSLAGVAAGYRAFRHFDPEDYFPGSIPSSIIPGQGTFKFTYYSYWDSASTTRSGWEVQFLPAKPLVGKLKLVQAVSATGFFGNGPHMDIDHSANNPAGVALWNAHTQAPQGGPLPDYVDAGGIHGTTPNSFRDAPTGQAVGRQLFTIMAFDRTPTGDISLGAVNFEFDGDTTKLAANTSIGPNNNGPVFVPAGTPGWVWTDALRNWQTKKEM